jgi:hypothetical protein
MSRRRASAGGRLTDALIAGLAGSSALNVVTYLDMVLRARPASGTPEQAARRVAEVVRVDLGTGTRAANRSAGLGPLLGYLAAVGASLAFVGVTGRRRPPLPVAAAALGATAMLTADGPMAALGVTDPRRWSRVDWLSDLVPHLAYGVAAAAVLRRVGTRRGQS